MDGIRLTGLWKNERDGKAHLSGSLGGGRLLVFPNERKQGDRDPDYVVYLVPAERREDGGPARGGGGSSRPPYRGSTTGGRPANDFADGGSRDAGDPFP